MAKFIFSEVRTKTILFDEIAKELISNGHKVIWIVQNHLFNPKHFTKKYIIPYPSKNEIEQWKDCQKPFFTEVLKSDRMVLYFKNKGDYYGYYYNYLERVFNEENVDVVFGELGNFHTHILSFISKGNNIPFYDIDTSRYPTGHFSFHLYDKYYPVIVNEKICNTLNKDEIENYKEAIIKRKVAPDYMLVLKRNQVIERIKHLPYRVRLFFEYLRGERYCTHNPLLYFNRRYKIFKKKQLLKKITSEITVIKDLKKNKKILLYPMQMQPEFNLDVWGAKYRDQELLISKIGKNLPDDWILIVKLNPKAREDINNNIYDVIKNGNQVFLLDPKVGMGAIEELSNLVITVTGTIALERLLKEEPVLVIGDSFLVKESYAPTISDISQLKGFLMNFEKHTHIRKQIQGDELMCELLKRSMKGIISEPLSYKNVLNKDNVINIYNGIVKLLETNGLS